MSDCECGAHYMQSCSWWCGQGLTDKEIWERENPVLAEIKKLNKEIKELKSLLDTGMKDDRD